MAKRATMADTIPIKGHAAVPERPAPVSLPSRTVPLTFRAPAELHERVRKLAFDTREPIQKIIEDAVSRHLDAHRGIMTAMPPAALTEARQAVEAALAAAAEAAAKVAALGAS